MTDRIINCPYCNELLLIGKINCGIFRHGVIKSTGKHMNPHATRKTCDKLMKKKLIYGCGNQFKIIIDNDNINIILCDNM